MGRKFRALVESEPHVPFWPGDRVYVTDACFVTDWVGLVGVVKTVEARGKNWSGVCGVTVVPEAGQRRATPFTCESTSLARMPS